MSETVTDPQGGAAEAEPAATDTTTTPAPVETGAATEATKTETEAEKSARLDKRLKTMFGRISDTDRENAKLRQELDQLRRAANPEPVKPVTVEDIPRVVEARVEEEIARRETERAVQSFHSAGRAAFPDWTERCQSLMQMGADAGLAELLVETRDGHKVVAALADDPEALENIAGLKTERARAIALGMFVAELASKPPPAPRVSQAPEPIRQIGGTARTVFNEHTASAAQLVEYYSKQAMKQRAAG